MFQWDKPFLNILS